MNGDVGLRATSVLSRADCALGPGMHAQGIRVTRVVGADSTREGLRAANIDGPRPDGLWRDPIEIVGWVLGDNAPVIAVQAVTRNHVLRTMPVEQPRPDVAERYPDVPRAGRCGFRGLVGDTGLSAEFHIDLEAVLADGGRRPLGRIEGHRAMGADSPGRPGRRSPLLVTTLGRTGSTWLIRLLSSHPEITACPPFRYESRLVTYWVDVLRALTEPHGCLRQLVPGAELTPGWWLGEGGGTVPQLEDASLEAALLRSQKDAALEFCRERLDAVCAAVAIEEGKPDARYFAEKLLPGRLVPELARELRPDTREIVLVRDFRDTLCSIVAFNEKRGMQGFGRGQAGSEEEYVDRLVTSASNLLDSWRNRAEDTLLVRYEDVILEPIESLRRVLAYLGLGAEASDAEAVLAEASRPLSGMEGHRTTADAEASIGRWRRDLTPRLQALCTERFEPILEALGYGDER